MSVIEKKMGSKTTLSDSFESKEKKQKIDIFTISVINTSMKKGNPLVCFQKCHSVDHVMKTLNIHLIEGSDIYSSDENDLSNQNESLILGLTKIISKLEKMKRMTEIYTKSKNWIICVNKLID